MLMRFASHSDGEATEAEATEAERSSLRQLTSSVSVRAVSWLSSPSEVWSGSWEAVRAAMSSRMSSTGPAMGLLDVAAAAGQSCRDRSYVVGQRGVAVALGSQRPSKRDVLVQDFG